MTGLGTLGGNEGYAYDVSDDGTVVVGFANKISGNFEAFRWEDGSMLGLETLGGSYSDAYAVSGDGSVIAGQSEDALGNFEGFRWEDGSGVGFGNPGSTYVWVRGMSADGSVIVGEYHVSSNPSGDPRAFRWENGVFTNIDTVPGRKSRAYSVSADGSVVVGWLKGEERDHAFIWNASEGMRELQPLLTDDFNIDLTGWALQEARGVSADGTVVVGFGRNPQGTTEGWIAVISEPYVIPEPTSLIIWSLLGALALTVGWWRRRRAA